VRIKPLSVSAALALSLFIVSGCAASTADSASDLIQPETLGTEDITRIVSLQVGQAAYFDDLAASPRELRIVSSHPSIVASLSSSRDDNTVVGIDRVGVVAVGPGVAEVSVWPSDGQQAGQSPLRTYRINVER
jgi:hypothetical protein